MSELPPSAREPEAAGSAQPNTARTWVISGVVAAVVAVAVVVGLHFATSSSKTKTAAANPTAAQAAGQGANGRRFGANLTAGTISAIDGSKITLKEASGTAATVVTDAKTRVSERTSGSLSDVTVGSHVQVIGTGSSDQPAAQSITVGDDAFGAGPGGAGAGPGPGRFRQRNGNVPPPGGTGGETPPSLPARRNGSFVTGTVTAVDGSKITVTETARNRPGATTSTTAAAGSATTVTVTTSSATTVTVVKTLKVSDLRKRDKIAVVGATSGSTVKAASIIEGDTGDGFGFGGGRGFRGGGGFGPGGPGSGSGTPGGTPTTVA